MDTQILAMRIKEARELRDYTLEDIASDIGVARSTIQRYEAGRIAKPKIPVIHAIAKSLKVNPAWLSGKDVPMERGLERRYTFRDTTDTHGVKIPVLGKVAAGIPIEAITDIVDYEEITMDMANKGSFFGLRIKGDSMEPRICENDVVIVCQQDDAESGEIVIATVNGTDATCKRLKKYEHGIALIPINPNHEPMFFSNEDIVSMPVKVIGRVVELRGKF